MSAPSAQWAGQALISAHDLPALGLLVLNVTAFIFASFIALTWIRRRSELMVGLVAMLWGGASLRNVWRLFIGTPAPYTWMNWADMAVHMVLPALAIHLCLSILGPVSARRVRALYGGVAVFLLAGLALYDHDDLFQLRLGGYAGLLIAAFLTFIRAMQRRRAPMDETHRVIIRCLGLVWVASLLDYARIALGWGDRLPSPLPYAVPLALLMSAWALLQRLVRHTAQAQLANAELERRVQQRTKELESANLAKSRFLASASHDLRQPVVTIGLLIDLLRDLSRDDTQRAMIDRVDGAVASMETLLGGLLDLSRFEAGTVSPKREPIDVQALFTAVSSHSEETARMKGLRVHFRCAPGLGVRSDPLLLEQILRNLVSNALRYTQRGGVLVTARRRGQQALLQVWDTGIGIPAEQQSAIFEEFVQLNNPARERTRGLGLGLAIVQRAAALLGHRLLLRSVPGRGSCFGVELPLAPPPVTRARPSPAPQRPLAGLNLALLEDDPAVRAALSERLEQWGAEVWTFGTLRELLDACEPLIQATEPLPWALLITDQRLPDGSGIEAVAQLRLQRPQLPAVIITGNTMTDELAALECCDVAVLHKPFRTEMLLAEIGAALKLPLA